MAIYGIGSLYNKKDDHTKKFINNDFIEVGWSYKKAPDLHEIMKSLKTGDIVFIKSGIFSSPKISVKAVGIISDNERAKDDDKKKRVINSDGYGRNVKWLITEEFSVTNPISSKTDEDSKGKNNVVSNTIYQEFHPIVQKEVIEKIAKLLGK